MFITAVIIFCLAYALIISEKINQTIVALLGAVVMITLSILSQEEALAKIDFNTLGLLIGMMIIVSIAKHCGMFQYVAIAASKIAKGKAIPIFILMGAITAIFSAFLDNVTTVLLMAPVVFVVANNLNIRPKPFLISAILLSNIGGTATLIGDPPNILIGSAAGIDFNQFIINLGPISLLASAITIVLLVFIYRKELISNPESEKAIMQFKPSEAITDKKLLIKSLVIIGLVLLGFFTHGLTHWEAGTIAMAGATILLLITTKNPEHHLQHVEWNTIFFFIGLFVMVAGLEQVGAIRMLAEQLIGLTHGNLLATTMSILWGSTIASAVINNIPFVATMIPLIKDIGAITGIPLMPLWWALALGADIGGNATLVGASANVVVAGMAEKEGHRIGFGEYLKIAVPLTFVAMLVCTAYIWLRYLL